MISRFLKRILQSSTPSQAIPFESLHPKLQTISVNEIRLAAIVSSKPEDCIVIIGAHDLISFDSVSSYLQSRTCPVFCFEPRLSSCQALSRNIEELNISNIRIIPKAIHGSLSSTLLYEVNPDQYSLYPDWATGIASFSKDHLLRIARDEHIISSRVACSAPSSWLQEYKIDRISYLQIDTEGYDYEILRLIDLDFCRPRAILLEYANLSQADRISCHAYLAEKGYDTMINGEDLLAFNLRELLLRN